VAVWFGSASPGKVSSAHLLPPCSSLSVCRMLLCFTVLGGGVQDMVTRCLCVAGDAESQQGSSFGDAVVADSNGLE
jgi:hypothetical protein